MRTFTFNKQFLDPIAEHLEAYGVVGFNLSNRDNMYILTCEVEFPEKEFEHLVESYGLEEII